MNLKTAFGYVIIAVLVLLLVSLVLGNLLGSPVLLAYVDSGSMEPTLNEGDGFIAVPAPIAGDLGVGDVVVFEADRVEDGRITTHRIVDERPNGYITQGDANPFPDQSGSDPPVTEAEINAVALSRGGDPIRIPHLGTAVETVGAVFDRAVFAITTGLGIGAVSSNQLALVLFGIGIIMFATTFVGERSRRERISSRSRSRTGVVRTRVLLIGAIALLCTAATIGMVAPGGTDTFEIVSTEGNSSNPTIIPVGESDSFEKQLHNSGLLPTTSYFESRTEGIETTPDNIRLGPRDTANATVTMTAPDETGLAVRSTTEYRYYAVVPHSVIDRLYGIHPWLPYLFINGLIASIVLLLWAVFRQPTELRVRSRGRSRSQKS